MGLDPYKVLWLSLPSLCLLYTFSSESMSRRNSVVEVFGNEEQYLQLTYATNPYGIFAHYAEEIPFRAELTTLDTTEVLDGVRVKNDEGVELHIPTEGGLLVGSLRKVPGRCEPELQYRWTKGVNVHRGRMRAGFCP